MRSRSVFRLAEVVWVHQLVARLYSMCWCMLVCSGVVSRTVVDWSLWLSLYKSCRDLSTGLLLQVVMAELT